MEFICDECGEKFERADTIHNRELGHTFCEKCVEAKNDDAFGRKMGLDKED